MRFSSWQGRTFVLFISLHLSLLTILSESLFLGLEKGGSVGLRRHQKRSLSSRSHDLFARNDIHDDVKLPPSSASVAAKAALSSPPPISQGSLTCRRHAIWKSGVGLLVLSTFHPQAVAAAGTTIRVDKWPGLEYLEPIYELKLSVQALNQGASGDTAKFPMLQKRLDKFFSGGLISERNYYAGLGVKYINQIQYNRNELNEYIRLDKEERFNSMEDTLNSLNALLSVLKKKKSEDTYSASEIEEIQGYANQAKVSLDRWFALVPNDDIDRAGQLFLNARKADTNRNGQLEKTELETMPEEFQTIWKRRIDLVGG